MNLSKFLNSVDTLSSTMEQKQLVSFVHDIARALPESTRDDFLNKMKSCMNVVGKENTFDEEDHRKFEQLKNELDKIKSGEMCLFGELNEEYDDWYNTDETEFLFADPSGIGKIIERACQFIHEAIDKQLYDRGNEIAEILIGLEIDVVGEYKDYADELLLLAELERYGLISIDYKKLIVESLYLCYHVHEVETRADVLYTIIQDANMSDISLEMVMQCGEELPKLEIFLPKWIEYLGNQSTETAQNLLDEAINLSNNPNDLLKSARAYYEKHPELYRRYICENPDNLSCTQLMLIGREALEKINVKYCIRSEIALQLSDIVLNDSKKVTDDVEQYWLEAFRSDSRLVHFLRIMIECYNFLVWQEQLKEINHLHLKQSKARGGYWHSNTSDYNQIYLIALLSGEYQLVRERGMKHRGVLGWSTTYMKNGLAAFLIILYDGKKLSDGIKAMLNRVVISVSFSVEEYGKGTLRKQKETDYELLWRGFCQSKEQNPMSDKEQHSYLRWIELLLKKRVAGIMEGNHRKYYYECASYIAALGEVLESRGHLNAKQNLMLEYKQCYARRRAFHEELRNYGMKDKKK